MSDNETLLIGGSRDGQRIKCDPEFAWFPLPVEDDSPLCLSDQGEPRSHMKFEKYNRRQLRSRTKVFDLLVIDGMDTDEAMKMLIDNYNPKGKGNA